MALSIREIKDHIKNDESLPFKIITEGNTYLTVEDADGYRAYMQAETMSSVDDPNRFFGYVFDTVHLPNRNTGSGHRYLETSTNITMPVVLEKLNETLASSRMNIIHGKERMDTRTVKSGFLF